MKKDLELLLKLEELLITQKKYELMCLEPADTADIEHQVQKLRQQVPSGVLSRYDSVSRTHRDVIALVQDGICQGCQERISRRLALQVEQARSCVWCEHCGRFLISVEAAPKYIH